MEEVLPTPEQIRPTKKQRQLLEYLEKFIAENGYGPSYREIMVGCNYTSVATVAVHVKNLIARGHIRKNGRNARTLEVINSTLPTKPKLQTNEVSPKEEKWLVDKIEYQFQQEEGKPTISLQEYENMRILVDSLKILNMEGASLSFSQRLLVLKKRITPA